MAEKLYNRTTRICELDALQPDHLVALRTHMTKYDLGAIEPILCGETTSIKRKNNFLDRVMGGSMTTYTSVVITAVWLLWVVSSDKVPPTALSARLSEIEVKDYDPKMLFDRGLDVRARPTDTRDFGSYFIGLSEDPAGDRLHAGIVEAVKAAHTD